MISKVLFFLPLRCRYDSMQIFTEQLAAAFQRKGVASVIVDLKNHSFTEILQIARREDPDMTVCFNGILPDQQRGFLSDFLGIPHLTLLVDPPYQFLPLKENPYGLIACVDDSYCRLYETLGFDRSFFLPHAVDANLGTGGSQERIYEVTLLGTCLHADQIRARWEKRFSDPVIQLLESSAERVFSDPNTVPLEALCEGAGIELKLVERAQIEGVSFLELWYQLELYLRGRDRLELVEAIDDHELHIFGRDWEEASVVKKDNVTVHGPVTYAKALEIMTQSKVVINSVPVFKEGGHERIFSAPCCGALVLANESRFLNEEFSPGKDILSYPCHDKSQVNGMLAEVLQDEPKRSSMAAAAATRIRAEHSWDQRVETILNFLRCLV